MSRLTGSRLDRVGGSMTKILLIDPQGCSYYNIDHFFYCACLWMFAHTCVRIFPEPVCCFRVVPVFKQLRHRKEQVVRQGRLTGLFFVCQIRKFFIASPLIILPPPPICFHLFVPFLFLHPLTFLQCSSYSQYEPDFI